MFSPFFPTLFVALPSGTGAFPCVKEDDGHMSDDEGEGPEGEKKEKKKEKKKKKKKVIDVKSCDFVFFVELKKCQL